MLIVDPAIQKSKFKMQPEDVGSALLSMRPILLAAICWLVAAGVIIAQDGATTRDGVYSAAQAARGRMSYAIYCRTCHSADLSGGSDNDDPAPALVARGFGVNRRDLGNLFAYVRKSMPRDAPGSVSPPMVADILAFILSENGFPAGPRDLPGDADALSRIRIVERATP
jgi:mono/diheme cytochrome c family protein